MNLMAEKIFKEKWTTRDLLIINLAFSGLFLCAFSMPITILDLTGYWFLDKDLVCRFFLKILKDFFPA